jgi:hypothetical protein
MTDELGSHGTDLLYELSQIDPKGKDSAIHARDQAQALLQKPEVQAHFSPALRIAIDLGNAPSCEARLPLLPRAHNLGDERSFAILNALSAGTKRGCGKWKNQPCSATCKDEAPAFTDAVRAIGARLKSTRL